jgi:hypothetical protein
MKKETRKKLNREKPERRAYHRSLTLQPSKLPHYLGGSVADTQTKEERAEREIAAKVAAYRQQQRIAQAKPTSEKCSHKACPYPAVLEGECRKHALDRIATSSEFGSTLAIAASIAHILYC